jgi:hypothetical protein
MDPSIPTSSGKNDTEQDGLSRLDAMNRLRMRIRVEDEEEGEVGRSYVWKIPMRMRRSRFGDCSYEQASEHSPLHLHIYYLVAVEGDLMSRSEVG